MWCGGDPSAFTFKAGNIFMLRSGAIQWAGYSLLIRGLNRCKRGSMCHHGNEWWDCGSSSHPSIQSEGEAPLLQMIGAFWLISASTHDFAIGHPIGCKGTVFGQREANIWIAAIFTICYRSTPYPVIFSWYPPPTIAGLIFVRNGSMFMTSHPRGIVKKYMLPGDQCDYLCGFMSFLYRLMHWRCISAILTAHG